MQRRIKPKAEIESLIREEIRKHPECDGAQILDVYWHMPDEDGCNWDANAWRGPEESVLICKDCITAAVRELRRKYNIFDPTK